MTSIMWVASGRPAPRIASVANLLVITPRHVGVDCGRLVDPGHHERAQRRDQRREQHLVGAKVSEDLGVPRGERAVALGADLHVVDLVAPVVGDHHPLRARLDPLHRAPQLDRRPRAADLLGVDVELRAEATADLGRDHANSVLGDAEQDRQEQPQEVRDLGGAPHGQLPGAVLRQHAARLDRRSGHAMVDDRAARGSRRPRRTPPRGRRRRATSRRPCWSRTARERAVRRRSPPQDRSRPEAGRTRRSRPRRRLPPSNGPSRRPAPRGRRRA